MALEEEIVPDAASELPGLVIVTGSIVARPGTLDELLAISLHHVRRSRSEPGCISHDVHRDLENPSRLVFVERWTDRERLGAHFAVPASVEFARRAVRLAAEPPSIEIHAARPIR